MKMHRFLLLLLAVSGLSGCPGEPCFASGVGVDPRPPGMILVGEDSRLRVQPNIPFSCEPQEGEEVATPSSLTVEVYDPDNQPVEHQASLGTPSTLAASVRFTARKAGRHHVFVAFEPVGGIQQFDLYAAMDHTKEAAVHTLHQPCASLGRTSKGAFVCDQDVLRDGASEKRFTNSQLAVVGDVVWVVDGQKVQRYVDTGTALALTGTLNHTQGSAGYLHATETEVVVLFSGTMQRFAFNGTALASTGTSSWTAPSAPLSAQGPRLLLVRAGDHLGLVTRAASSPSTTAPRHEVCPYRLDNGRFVRASVACSSFNGIVVGHEAHALWVGEPQSFTEQNFTGLSYLEWTPTGLVTQASLPLGLNLKISPHPFAGRQTVIPTITASATVVNSLPRSAVATYSPERRAILLEHLDAMVEPLATRQLIWNSQTLGLPSSTTRVRVRPSTP